MATTPTGFTAFKVAAFETNRWLLWQQPVSSWAWKLDPLPDSATRLVTRQCNVCDWNHPAKEFGDFPMMRRIGFRDLPAPWTALALGTQRFSGLDWISGGRVPRRGDPGLGR
jgi:hypothetical protein